MNDPKNLTNSIETLRENLAAARAPGYRTKPDLEEVNRADAVVEDAAESGDDQSLTLITEGEPITDLPAFVNTDTVHSLYGWQPGESLEEAIARRKIQDR